MKYIGQKLAELLSSRLFFGIVLVIFVAEAAWIALSARYPMAFDESYHLGIIRLYAHQLSPLFDSQPPGPAPFGALTRDPSYLHHWLLSWPYRWLQGAYTEQTTIICLRLINTAFFVAGLVLWRRVLLQTKASAALVHASLLFFILVPVVPLLAGQINYDNLLMLIVPWNLLLLLRFRRQLLQKKRIANLSLGLTVISIGLLGSLTKFAYLPILTAAAAYMVFLLCRYGKPQPKLLQDIKSKWRTTGSLSKYGSLAFFIVSAGLFIQMYGVNIVRYHNIVAQCGQVLGVEPCKAYGPWARNYEYALANPPGGGNPVSFLGGWLGGMFERSFFAINGSSGPAKYANQPPPPILTITAVVVFGFGLYLVFRFRKKIFAGDPVLVCLLFVAAIYLIALMGRNYHDYLQLGQLVAINGRYLVLIILPIMLAIGLGYQYYFRRRTQALIAAVVFLLFLQGGGALSFIRFSTPDWYWSGDHTALVMNQRAQTILDRLIITMPKQP